MLGIQVFVEIMYASMSFHSVATRFRNDTRKEVYSP